MLLIFFLIYFYKAQKTLLISTNGPFFVQTIVKVTNDGTQLITISLQGNKLLVIVTNHYVIFKQRSWKVATLNVKTETESLTSSLETFLLYRIFGRTKIKTCCFVKQIFVTNYFWNFHTVPHRIKTFILLRKHFIVFLFVGHSKRKGFALLCLNTDSYFAIILCIILSEGIVTFIAINTISYRFSLFS